MGGTPAYPHSWPSFGGRENHKLFGVSPSSSGYQLGTPTPADAQEAYQVALKAWLAGLPAVFPKGTYKLRGKPGVVIQE